MKYFKHECDAAFNKKLRKLKRICGAEGYGIYFQIIELIGRDIEKSNFSEWGYLPDEYMNDHEFLAEEVGTTVENLSKTIYACLELNLLEKKGDKERLYCSKVLERADEYTQKLIRQFGNKLESKSEDNPDSVGTTSGQHPDSVVHKKRKEQNRKKQKRREENEKKPTASKKYLLSIPDDDVNAFHQYYEVSVENIKTKGEALHNWLVKNGRTYKNYRAALQDCLLKDFGKRKTEIRKKVRYELDPVTKSYREIPL